MAILLPLGRLGYRGLALLMFGFIYGAMAVSVYLNHEPDPALFHTLAPLWVRIAIWAGAGTVAVLAAFLHRLEPLGFGLLIVGPIERGLSFAVALATGPSLGRLTGVVVYLFMALVVLLIAAWPEPVTSRRKESR